HLGRAKRRKNGIRKEFLSRQRACQSEVEEARKLLSLLQSFVSPVFCSPPGQHSDTNCFRQLLCPDPLCEVCNRATAEVKRLLFQESPEDAVPSVSPLTSTATEEPSPPSASILSPDLTAPLPDLPLPSPLDDSLPPQPVPPLDSKVSLDHSPPQLLAFTPLPPPHIQGADPVFQAEATLFVKTIYRFDPILSQDTDPLPNVSQEPDPTDSHAQHHKSQTLFASPLPDCTLIETLCKSISTLVKPVLEITSPESSDGLSTYVPKVRGNDHSISEFSQCQAHAINMFLPTSPHPDFQQEHVSFYLPETSPTKHMEASSLSFLGFNIQELLERQIKKRMAFQVLEKKYKEKGPFSKQMWSEYQPTSSGNSLQALVDEQNMIAPQTGWNIKDTPDNLHICQPLLYVKTLGGNFQQKYNQFFWGLPSLHSESLVAPLLVSRSNSPLDSCIISFNESCNSPAVQMQDQESPSFPQSHPPPPTHVHPYPFSQTSPQPHVLPLTQVHSQAHLQSSLPMPPSSFLPQIKDCGVCFHRLQNEAGSHISNENQHLEWHVLQKQQEGLWGVVPVLQKSQAVFFPAPNLPSVNQSSHTSGPGSTCPGHFNVYSETQEELEFHVPKRLMSSWCRHTCKNRGSLALMEPQCKSTEISQQNYSHTNSESSELHGHGSKDVGKTELSCLGSFHEGVSTKFHLRKEVPNNLGHIMGKWPLDKTLEISKCILMREPRAASEAQSDLVCCSRNNSGEELLSVSRSNLDQNQRKSILRLHLTRKSWQITADRIPIDVCRSWLADNNVLCLPGSSHHKMERNLASLASRAYCKISTLGLSFLDPKTYHGLEAHIMRFRLSQTWGLPLRVLESIKFYALREAKTWPLPQFDFFSSGTYFSRLVSKSFKETSKTFQGNKLRMSSVPILNYFLPETSPIGKEERGFLRQSPSEADHEHEENAQTTEHGRQTLLPCTHSSTDNARQKQTILAKRHSPKLPMGQNGARQASGSERVSFSDSVERLQDESMVKKDSKHFFVSNVLPQSTDTSTTTTSELGSSSMINVNKSEDKITVTTTYSPSKISIPEDSTSLDLERQLVSEIKFPLKSEEHSQTEDGASGTFYSSDCLASESSLPCSKDVSSRSLATAQVLRLHMNNGEVIMEQREEPLDPKDVLEECQDMDFPSFKRVVIPLGLKAGESGNEDPRLQTYKAKRKCHFVKDKRTLEGASNIVGQDKPCPPESYFRKKIREFFQWF
uniref:Uncharacterized protein n=1 Tax=Otolemur garnettii TaxID=30611 RepID=H0XLJ9_OTOGA